MLFPPPPLHQCPLRHVLLWPLETGPCSILKPATTSPTAPTSPTLANDNITPPAWTIIPSPSRELDKVPASFRPTIREMLAVDPSVHQVEVLESSSAIIS